MTVATATFAFDKKSARTFDADGRMRVRDCIISVAEVNPYYGKEIPGRERLGLDANTVYDLYRDPAELERAADSFNGLPLMIRHIAQTADEPRKEYIGGSVFNARYADGKLRADLLVMDAKAIEYIESGELADLSSSYRYTPDMSPGEADGRKFHGRMRGIEGNHVALVEDGRATGAHVADRALSSPTGATDVDPNPNPDTPNPAAGNADVATALLLLTQKLETIETRLTSLEGGGAAPAGAITVDPPEVIDDAEPAGEPDPDDKPAMDAKAVQAVVDAAVKAERARASATEAAKRATRHVLGDMIAMDSAGDIYRAALKQSGVDVAAIAEGHEQTAWTAYTAAGASRAALANDSRLTPDNKTAPFDASLARIRLAGR